jgi:hypothetical protein
MIDGLNRRNVPANRERREAIEKFLIHRIRIPPSWQQEVFLQVFKFLPGNFIASTLSVVWKQFYSIAWNEELWLVVTAARFQSPEFMGTWRETYINSVLLACWVCGMIKLNEKFYICPVRRRAMCYACAKRPEFSIVYRKEIRNLFGIRETVLKMKYAKLKGFSVTYLSFM